MREILTISIDKNLKNRVNKIASKLKISKSELVKKEIEKYIIHEEISSLRKIFIPKAEKLGYFTDEDIFKEIS